MIEPTSRTDTVLEKKTETVLAVEGQWNVVVLSDPVNPPAYMTMVFRRVLGFSEPVALEHVAETRKKGRSIVWTGAREKAEAYVYSLQEWHLSAILEKDAQH